MNLQSWFNNVAGAGDRTTAGTGFFRQICRGGISLAHIMKLFSVRAISVSVCLVWALVLGGVSMVSAQTNYYSPNGTEYPIVSNLLGDQMFPDVAISTTNGMVVWQDNSTDGDGWGISAQRLDGTLSGTLGNFTVNVIRAGDQENPRVALLKNGGAAFVWQGGVSGFQHIYARFLNPTNTFYSTNDILVNTFTNNFQINPALTVLTNGNVAVVWASYNQASSNSMQDVYCQILSTNGAKIGTNFLVNQFTQYNQRTPTVAALKNGGFVVAWVSEQERSTAPNLGANTTYVPASGLSLPSVDIYARLFNASGTPTTGEILANTDSNPCATPVAAVASDGSFLLAWGEKDQLNPTNGWDIYARPFTSAGVGGTTIVVNTYNFGDQYIPRISCIGLDYLLTWTSLGQDGSREGVFGQFVHNNGALVGGEFQVNTTSLGQQMQPTVASDGVSQFLTVWTSFTGAPYGFDLYAQRYLNVSSLLLPMSAPYVWVPFVISNSVVTINNVVRTNSTYLPELVVSWAPVLGLSVANYEVYVDGAGSPTGIVPGNSWTMTAANGLAASTTHSFQVDYVTTDGRRSPLSPSASGTTWSGQNDYGIPFEWIEAYYGDSYGNWPSNVNAPLIPGGLSLYQVFQSGGNPLDPSTWLQQQITQTAQGMFLNWNTQPGATYQVQITTNFTTWNNLGSPRFAAGSSDSMNIGSGSASYYRVVLLR
jgi:hypothetical protein